MQISADVNTDWMVLIHSPKIKKEAGVKISKIFYIFHIKSYLIYTQASCPVYQKMGQMWCFQEVALQSTRMMPGLPYMLHA